MLITNLTILAVELKKLIGGNCKAEMFTESTLIVTSYGDSSNESKIKVDIINDLCRVEIVVSYTTRLDNVVDAAAKLRGDDVIHVYCGHAQVHKTYVMTMEQFSSLSVEQIEHAAKDIVGTAQGM